VKIVADTNTFIAVALNEPEKEKIIQLAQGHDLIAPDVPGIQTKATTKDILAAVKESRERFAEQKVAD
jgi:hypothetical protein